MSQRIVALEMALQQINDAKKQLYRNTTEAKSRIQCNISRQLEALRNREVWLLSQLDVVAGAKEEVLQQQSARLHKTLGVLQSCRDTDSDSQRFTRLELEDIQPEETPHVSFKADATALRDAIMSYGKIDSSTVAGVQSPYTAPDQPAPSLPRHFEDYNDAEHHVLYKTVEEVSRNKTEKPCVYVNFPKLSSRIEDWLLMPKAPATTATEPKYTFPKLSNNLADWLKAPISICKTGAPRQATPLDGISQDASIKTWLHKIKQNPYEEDEDDFEFIEEMSETRTQNSEELQEQGPVLSYGINQDMWLYQRERSPEEPELLDFKVHELPMDKWLLKSSGSARQTDTQTMVSMSHLLTKVTDELDKWLLAPRCPARHLPGEEKEAWVNLNTQTKPPVPSSLHLAYKTGADNPWLLRQSASPQLHRSASPRLHRPASPGPGSPASSRGSMCGASTKSCRYNKWLLNGGQSEVAPTSYIPCPIMDNYTKNMANTVWLKSAGPSPPPNTGNPLANFCKEHTDISVWLKPSSFNRVSSWDDFADKSPLKSFLDYYKSASVSDWLAPPGGQSYAGSQEKPLVNTVLKLGETKWLHTCSSASSLPSFDDDMTEEEL